MHPETTFLQLMSAFSSVYLSVSVCEALVCSAYDVIIPSTYLLNEWKKALHMKVLIFTSPKNTFININKLFV